MKLMVESVYLMEIIRRADFNANAARRIDDSVANKRTYEIFENLDAFIDHAGRMSCILWPTGFDDPKSAKKTRVIRGKYLRDVLEVPVNHDLSIRKLRNHLQHYDERLDSWASEDISGYIDSNIGPKSGHIVINGNFPPVMRNYDPTTATYTFRNDDFSIPNLFAAVMDIRSKASRRNDEINKKMFGYPFD